MVDSKKVVVLDEQVDVEAGKVSRSTLVEVMAEFAVDVNLASFSSLRLEQSGQCSCLNARLCDLLHVLQCLNRMQSVLLVVELQPAEATTNWPLESVELWKYLFSRDMTWTFPDHDVSFSLIEVFVLELTRQPNHLLKA
jgi:hypothetical protein